LVEQRISAQTKSKTIFINYDQMKKNIVPDFIQKKYLSVWASERTKIKMCAKSVHSTIT